MYHLPAISFQYRNPGNPLAHYDGTAEEIIEACDGKEFEYYTVQDGCPLKQVFVVGPQPSIPESESLPEREWMTRQVARFVNTSPDSKMPIKNRFLGKSAISPVAFALSISLLVGLLVCYFLSTGPILAKFKM